MSATHSRRVGHAWAHGDGAAKNHGGSLYAVGPTIYSYGTHYAIAHRATTPQGDTVVFLNDASPSVTTAKHRGIVRAAIPGYWLHYYAPELSEDMLRYPHMLIECIARHVPILLAQAAKTRAGTKKRAELIETARGYVETARAAADILPKTPAEKKDARAALRALPALPADDGPALADYLTKLESAALRAEARKLAGSFAADFARLREYLRAADAGKPRGLDAFRPYTSWNSEPLAGGLYTTAHWRLTEATRLSRKAGARNPVPVKDRREFETMRERVEAHARTARAGFLQDRARDIAAQITGPNAEPQSLSVLANTLEFCQRGADECPALAAQIPVLETLHKAAARADAENEAQRHAKHALHRLESAQTYAGSGMFADALRALHFARDAVEQAQRAAREHGFPCPELPELPDGAAWRAAIEAQHAEKIAQWRAGSIASVPRDVGPLLRLEWIDGKPARVATSHYADVPVSAAPILWRLICKARRDGRDLEFTGRHIGAFPLHRIRADGSAVIGCHDIAAAEFDAIATDLGYTVETAGGEA